MKKSNNKFWTVLIVLAISFLLVMVIKNKLTTPEASIHNDLTYTPKSTELQNNMKAAGLKKLQQEGSVTHNHEHLDIIINGKNISIPANIGIGSNFISPIHIHDEANILHIESPYRKNYTLGQFFTQWGVRLDNECIGNYCQDDSHKLQVYTNGKEISNPEKYILKQYDQIEIWYGPKDEEPQIISSFDFPEDL